MNHKRCTFHLKIKRALLEETKNSKRNHKKMYYSLKEVCNTVLICMCILSCDLDMDKGVIFGYGLKCVGTETLQYLVIRTHVYKYICNSYKYMYWIAICM